MSRFRRLLRWALLAFLGAVGPGRPGAGHPVLPDRPQAARRARSCAHVELQEPLYVYSRDGRLMALFGETRRYPVEIEKVPPQRQAGLHRHRGRALLRAPRRRLQGHRAARSGCWPPPTTSACPAVSTITQQVARQFFLSSEYSYTRKLAEMLLAMRMEQRADARTRSSSSTSTRASSATAPTAWPRRRSSTTASRSTSSRLDEAATLAVDPEVPVQRQPDHQPGAREAAPRLRAAAHARAAASSRRRRKRAAQAGADARHAARAAGRGVRALRRGDGAPGDGRALRRRRADQGLPRHHHHRPDAAGRRRPGGPRRPGRLRPPPRLARRREAGRARRRRRRRSTLRAHLRGIPRRPACCRRSSPAPATAARRCCWPTARRSNSTPRPAAGPAARPARCSSAATSCACAATCRSRPPTKDGKPAAAAERRRATSLDQLPRAQAALVSLDAETGALRALVGGFSFAGNKFNRATQARASRARASSPSCTRPRSSAASSRPRSCSTRRWCSATAVGHLWRPQNDTGNFAGPMRLREALVQSRNLVSVRLLDAIGVDYARKYISHFGFHERRAAAEPVDVAGHRLAAAARRSRAATRCSPTAASWSRRGSSTR